MVTVNAAWATVIRESWMFEMWMATKFRKRRRYERHARYQAEARTEWERLGKPNPTFKIYYSKWNGITGA